MSQADTGGRALKVLSLTNMYPTPKLPSHGTFVQLEVESLRQEGLEVDVLFINGGETRLHYLWAFPRLWARLLRRRYDLIHAHYVFTGVIARAQFLYPVVLTLHGGEVLASWQAPLSRIVSKLVDKVIVRTEEMKERIGYPAARIIPAGIDFNLFMPMPREQMRRQLGLPARNRLVLYAGEYWKPEKRFDIVQKAVALLQKSVPEVELVLVAKRPLSVIPKYMNACDVLVLVSDSEGSPNVIKEAMACNLPIVSVPVGDVPQILGSTEGCLLCSQEPEDVAEKLQLALAWGRRTNGRERVIQLQLSLEQVSQRIIALYEDLVNGKRRGLAHFWFWRKDWKWADD